MKKFSLQILLELADKFSGPLKSGPMRRLAELQRQTQAVDRGMDNLFTGGAIIGGAAAFAAPLVAGTVQAIRFEEAMADVKRVTEFKPKVFRELSADVLRLSLRIPLATEELAQLVEAGGQSKLYKTRSELLRFAQDSGKMATAFKMSAADAGGAMTGFRTIFRLSQNEVVSLGDAYNYLGNNMDARASDIVNIANRTGATAKLFGLTGQQVGALGASFLALKTPPEVAATGVNALLNRLATAPQQTEKFQGGLARLGLEATSLKRSIGTDAQGALLDFLQRVRGSGDVLGILTDLFGAEYSDDIAKLVGSLNVYEGALGLVGDQSRYAGSMQKEYAAQSATTKNALVLLQNNFNALGTVIGSFYLPVIRLASRTMGYLIGPIIRLVNANPVLARTLAFVTAAVILLTIAAGVGIVTIAGFSLATAQARIALATFAGASGAAAVSQSLLSLALTGIRARFAAATIAARSFAAAMVARGSLGMVDDLAKIDGAGGKLFRLRAILGVVRGGFVAAAGAAWAFTASLLTNPVFLLIAALVALGAGFVYAWRKSDEFRAGVMRGLEPIRRSWAGLKEDIAGLGQAFAPLGAFFGRILGRMGLDFSKVQRPLDALRFGFGFFVGFVGTTVAITFGRIFAYLITGFGGVVQVVDGLVTAATGLATLDFQKMMEGLDKARGGVEQTLLAPLELAGVDSKQFRKDLGGVEGVTKSWQQRVGNWLGVPASVPAPDTQPFAFGLNTAMWIAEGWGVATRTWVGQKFQTAKANTTNLLDSIRSASDEGKPVWQSLLDKVTAPFDLPRANRRNFTPSLENAASVGAELWATVKAQFPAFALPALNRAESFVSSLAGAETAGGDAWGRIRQLFPAFNLPWVKRLNFDTSLTEAEGSGSTIWGRVASLLKVAIPIPGVDASAIQTSLQGVLDTITGFGPQMLEAGKSLIGSLIDGFNERVGELTAFLDKLKFPWQKDKAEGGAPALPTPAVAATYTPPVANRTTTPYAMRPPTVSGLPGASPPPTVPGDFTQSLGAVAPASQLGQMLALGFADGIFTNQDVAKYAAREMAAGTITEVQRMLDSHSPSRVFRKLGHTIPQGVEGGVRDLAGRAVGAVRAMAVATVAAGAISLPAIAAPAAPNLPVVEQQIAYRGTQPPTPALAALERQIAYRQGQPPAPALAALEQLIPLRYGQPPAPALGVLERRIALQNTQPPMPPLERLEQQIGYRTTRPPTPTLPDFTQKIGYRPVPLPVPVAPQPGAPELPDRYAVAKVPALERSANRRQEAPNGTAPGAEKGAQIVHKHHHSNTFTLDMSGINSKDDFTTKLENLLEWFGDDE